MWLGISIYLIFFLFVLGFSGLFFRPLLTASSNFITMIGSQISRVALILISASALIMLSLAYGLLNAHLDSFPFHDVFASTYSFSKSGNFLEFHFESTPRFFFPFTFIFIFITILSIYFCLAYSAHEAFGFVGYCLIILAAGFVLLFTDSFVIFFLAYECLLIPSFLILYKFAKTRRCIEAAYLMFFGTQFGALFLIFGFIYLFAITHSLQFSTLELFSFSQFEVNFLFFLGFIGFGVKIPIGPFYGGLPKAHVEASTNFSIFLSGVLVKFAFFGLLKCLFALGSDITFIGIVPILTIGILDAVFKMFYQSDLKKLVAYATVVEMHGLTLCIVSGQSYLGLAGSSMLISHALISSTSFLLVDSINRRFKTRQIFEISGLNFLCPKLFLACFFNCVIFLGFPGTIFFVAEFLFFSFCFDFFPILAMVLVVVLYFFMPTFFFRTGMNAMFGLSAKIADPVIADLDTREQLLLAVLFILIFGFGISGGAFIAL